MSLSGLAKRLRKPRDKEHTAYPQEESASLASATVTENGSAATSDLVLVAPAVEHSGESISMPVPEPTPVVAPMLAPQPTPYAATTPGPVEHVSAVAGALAELAPLKARLDEGPSVAKTRGERKLDAIGDGVGKVATRVSPAITVLKNATSTDLTQQIQRGIQRFADDIPWLMKSLDELARIHPVVTVAVLAFKTVYTLETTRQENDLRVATLYVEMKDMMTVMVQLRRIDKQVEVGLDGKLLKDRLQELAEKTADDIKECANVCDTFLKKRAIVKFFKAPVWADKLADFVKVFAVRKGECQLALQMHTANSLADVKQQNYEIQAKLNTILELFRDQFATAEERKVASDIQRLQKGGKVRQGDDTLVDGGRALARPDDDTLRALIAMDAARCNVPESDGEERKDFRDPKDKGLKKELTDHKAVKEVREKEKEPQIAQTAHMRKDLRMSGEQKPLTVDQLKAELREGVDDALERNREMFEGKFELQVSFLRTALERHIHMESDRVIGDLTNVITQGPHMKIKDLELRKVWQEMNWRGNVKARLFVMTLQDHYRDEFERTAHAPGAVSTDQWALKYLNSQGLWPIMEAFDDDASGYVTITEVNKLMDLRPPSLGWSVPHWLAYLAIGWKIAANSYIKRILMILARMRDTIDSVLPANRNSVDAYFDVWWWIMMLVYGVSLNLEHDDEMLRDRFQEYIDMEEQRIRGNLQKVKYAIDASDTLFLVVGAGNLDKAVWPLLFLLLENDWIKFSAARKYSLDRGLFAQAQQTMSQVSLALSCRRYDLERRFTHQKLDLKTQFKTFACGLYSYFDEDFDFWYVQNKDNPAFHQYADEESFPIIDELPEDVTKNGRAGPNTIAYDTIDGDAEEDLTAPEPVKSILGEWNGFAYDQAQYPFGAMLTFHFHLSDSDNSDFTSKGVQPEFDGDPFTVTGIVKPDPDGAVLKCEWKKKYSETDIVYYFGTLVDEYTIVGWIGISIYDLDLQFVLKKIPAEYMIYRPSPHALGEPLPPRPPILSPDQSPTSHPTNGSSNEGSRAHSVPVIDIGETKGEVDVTDGDASPEAGGGVDTNNEATVGVAQDVISTSDETADVVVDIGSEIVASPDGHSALDVGAESVDPNGDADPGPAGTLVRSKYRALWDYAMSAILHDVRRKWWTWSYFAARRDARKNFLKEHVGLNGIFPYDPVHCLQVSATRLACTNRDATFYEALAFHLSNSRPYSNDLPCSSKFRPFNPESCPPHWVTSARLICLECEPDPKQFCNWVVFCDDPRCYTATLPNVGISPHVCSHDPTHSLVKVRTNVHRLQWGSLCRRAVSALRYMLWEPCPRDPPSADCTNGESPPGVQGSAFLDPGTDSGQPEESSPVRGDETLPSSSAAPRAQDADTTSPVPNEVVGQPEDAEKGAGLVPHNRGDGEGSTAPVESPTASVVQVSESAESVIEAQEGRHVPNLADGETQKAEVKGDVEGNVSKRADQHTSQKEDDSVSEGSTNDPITCYICREEVFMGKCWYCVDCHAYICNACESKTLIVCRHCEKPFPQPEWYHGNGPNDFICAMCCARGKKGPDPTAESPPGHDAESYSDDGRLRHVYTHPLVQCRRPDPNAPPKTAVDLLEETETDRRLASMEERLSVMDAKFEGLQRRFDELEKQLGKRLAEHLEKAQESIQKVFLEKFAETLTDVLTKGMNAKA